MSKVDRRQIVEFIAIEGRDRDRHVLQVFLAPSCRHDNFFARIRALVLSENRRRRDGEKRRGCNAGRQYCFKISKFCTHGVSPPF